MAARPPAPTWSSRSLDRDWWSAWVEPPGPVRCRNSANYQRYLRRAPRVNCTPIPVSLYGRHLEPRVPLAAFRSSLDSYLGAKQSSSRIGGLFLARRMQGPKEEGLKKCNTQS